MVPDPYLEVGGPHRSSSGGTLAPHTDFHEYGRLGYIAGIFATDDRSVHGFARGSPKPASVVSTATHYYGGA